MGSSLSSLYSPMLRICGILCRTVCRCPHLYYLIGVNLMLHFFSQSSVRPNASQKYGWKSNRRLIIFFIIHQNAVYKYQKFQEIIFLPSSPCLPSLLLLSPTLPISPCLSHYLSLLLTATMSPADRPTSYPQTALLNAGKAFKAVDASDPAKAFLTILKNGLIDAVSLSYLTIA